MTVERVMEAKTKLKESLKKEIDAYAEDADLTNSI
jgi:hypothetical protein